jgi:hypothetical protein
VLDPFAQDDGFVPGKGRKRPRYSLQREDWRIVDEPDSPHEQEEPVDWEQALDQELDEADANVKPIEEQSTEPSPVFAMPSLEFTGSMLGRRAEESINSLSHGINQAQVHFPTDTPQIRPVPSPGLPIPSPLVSDHVGSAGYFPSWTASMETQAITSFPTEPATPPESFNETFETEAETIDFHQTDPVEPGVEPEQTFVLDAVVPPSVDLESLSGPDYQLAQGRDDNLVDICSSSDELKFDQVHDSLEDTSNQTPIHEEQMEDGDEPIHTFEATENASADAKIVDIEVHTTDDDMIEDVGELADEEQSMDVQSQEEIIADLRDGQLKHDVEPVEPENEHDIEKGFEPPTQSVQNTPPAEELDIDAIHALEMMMGAREREESRINRASQEIESGDEIDRSSLATRALDRSRSESHSEDDELVDDEMDDEEDRYDEQSADDYDSDEEEGQDGFSVDESDADDSEQEQDFPSQARPAQSQEIIVLDSDSEDEPARPPAKSASQPPEEDRPSYRAGSADSHALSIAAEFAAGEQEVAESWDVDPEQDDYESAGEESEIDQNESDEIGDRKDYDLDGRVYESDKDGESAQDPSDVLDPLQTAADIFEQGEDENMDSIQPTDNEETHIAAQIESSIEAQQPHNHASDEYDSNPPDPAEILRQDQSESVESDTEQSGYGDHAASYFNVDGSAESRIAHAAEIDVTMVENEPTLQPPQPLGSLSSIKPQLEQQLLAPDLTQDARTLNRPAIDLESDINLAVNYQETPTELDTTSQPPPVSDFPDLGEEDIPQVDGHPDEYHNAVSAFELAETIERPEQERLVPEVVISAEVPQTHVQPPAPDRHASGLRSKLSYFAPLATLIDHYDALVDTISIVQEASPITRSKGGSKDWFMTIQITDPSMAGTTLNAQIFRRYKASMPSLVEGSALLLRDFKVRSFEHSFMLVSVESSAWAVFDGSGPDAEINGPPVEYDSEERAYASGLRRWYTEVGSASVADRMLQATIERDTVDREFTPNSEVPSESGSPSSKRGSRRRRTSRKVTIHELRDGTRYTEVGSPNSRNSSVHELRDGTLYANI